MVIYFGSQIRIDGIAGTHVTFEWWGAAIGMGAITSDAAGNVYMTGIYRPERLAVVIRSEVP